MKRQEPRYVEKQNRQKTELDKKKLKKNKKIKKHARIIEHDEYDKYYEQ